METKEVKELKDKVAILSRKLKNAEHRYTALLGEYNKYQRDVSLAFRNIKQNVLNTNMSLSDLEKLV